MDLSTRLINSIWRDQPNRQRDRRYNHGWLENVIYFKVMWALDLNRLAHFNSARSLNLHRRPPSPHIHLIHKHYLHSIPYTCKPTNKMTRPPRGKELDPQTRSRICELHSIGWGPKKIQERHPTITISTIKTTISREGLRNNNQTMPRSGRPRVLTEEQRDRVYELKSRDPGMTVAKLLEEVGHVVKKRSMQRVLKEMGMERRKVVRRRGQAWSEVVEAPVQHDIQGDAGQSEALQNNADRPVT